MQAAVKVLTLAIEAARAGVDYTPKNGAVCPFCGKHRIPTYKTMPWAGDLRVRYHHCNNPECPLCELNGSVKSVQFNQ